VKELLNTRKAAQRLRVSVSRVKQFAQEGRIGRKHGSRDWLFTPEELARFAKTPRPRGRRPKKKKTRKKSEIRNHKS